MTKHTPGPWRVGNWASVYAEDLSCMIAECHGCTNQMLATAQANARLIAAAPETAAERDRLKASNAELIETLRLIDELATNGLDHAHPRNGATISAIASAARAAIVKAEGRP